MGRIWFKIWRCESCTKYLQGYLLSRQARLERDVAPSRALGSSPLCCTVAYESGHSQWQRSPTIEGRGRRRLNPLGLHIEYFQGCRFSSLACRVLRVGESSHPSLQLKYLECLALAIFPDLLALLLELLSSCCQVFSHPPPESGAHRDVCSMPSSRPELRPSLSSADQRGT